MLDMFRKKGHDDGVLTSLRTVSRWLQELPTGDIYSAQEQVVQRLIQFNHAGEAYNKERLQVLMALDEKTREMQDSLCRQYLRNARMSKSIESRLWTAIHAFYWEVTRGYHAFLMDFIANPGGSRVEPYIPQISVRAARGFADIIKWRYFRYEKLDDKHWLRLHNIYRVAEFDRFADTPVTVYPGETRPRCVAEEYGQALLLSPFGSGNLLPREIEMIDQWLDNWSDRIRIDAGYVAGRHEFCVDTGKGQGLQRCGKAVTDANLRFLSTQSLLARIEEVRAALKEGTLPVALGLSDDFRLPEGYGLLNQAEAGWSSPGAGERRRDARSPCAGQWRVMHGLADISTALAKAVTVVHRGNRLNPEAMLDIKLYGFVTERTMERLLEQEREARQPTRQDVWEQHDESGSGLAFKVGPRDGDWLKIGRLIAFAPVDAETWCLGTIRRLANRDQAMRLVGVRRLAESVQAVQLKPEDAGTTDYIVDEPGQTGADTLSAALLVQDDQGAEHLIMDGARYSRSRRFVLRPAKGDSREIRLEAVEETGESWLRVGFSEVTD